MPQIPSQTVGPPNRGAPTRRLGAEAFADAFTEHSRALWCIAAGVLRNRDQVEDVLQEGAVIALEKLDQFEPDTSFLAWMGRIVRYVALNHGRKKQRARTTATLDAVDAFAPATPDRAPAPADPRGRLVTGQSAFDDDVVDALSDLEETPRACVLLRTLLDMPYREIALALDIPEGTAMSHVHRGRRKLRDHLTAAERRSAASGRTPAPVPRQETKP